MMLKLKDDAPDDAEADALVDDAPDAAKANAEADALMDAAPESAEADVIDIQIRRNQNNVTGMLNDT